MLSAILSSLSNTLVLLFVGGFGWPGAGSLT